VNLLRLTDAHHTLLIGPTRSGKGRSVIIPTLMTNPETFLTIDVKGENFEKVSRFREIHFNTETIALDPFRIQTNNPATLNPLSVINPNTPESLSQIHALAESLIENDPNAKDGRHWRNRAIIHTKGVIATVVYFFPPEVRNLQQVANILASDDLLASAISKLRESDLSHGLLRRLGDEMLHPKGKELDGIRSTIGASLAFLSDHAIYESTISTSFDIHDLTNKSIYLILPLKYVLSHAGIMRLWTTAFMQAVIARGLNGSPVNIILDEVSTMRDLPVFKEMLSIGAGYGVKAMFVYQSLAQIGVTFPEDKGQTLMANTSHIFLRVQDKDTLEHVSSVLCKYTLVIENGSDGTSTSSQHAPHGNSTYSNSTSHTRSTQQIAREMLRPEEVRGVVGQAIVIHPGVPPIATTLALYDQHDLNPRRMGMTKMIAETLCLFAFAVFVAVICTGTLYYHGKPRDEQNQGDFRVHQRPWRPGVGRR
jgi:type IV secretion system protein VirD4